MDWEEDKARADLCLPAAQRLLGGLFIVPASQQADQEEATDLVLFNLRRNLTVAWRNRDAELYLGLYPFDVTIRASRPTGATTELAKILAGFASFLLYSFGRADAIVRWCLVDLDRLRRAVATRPHWRGTWPLKTNGDGTTFVVLDTRHPVMRWCLHSASVGFWTGEMAAEDEPPPDASFPRDW